MPCAELSAKLTEGLATAVRFRRKVFAIHDTLRHNPSVTALPCHLPLHKGGFWCSRTGAKNGLPTSGGLRAARPTTNRTNHQVGTNLGSPLGESCQRKLTERGQECTCTFVQMTANTFQLSMTYFFTIHAYFLLASPLSVRLRRPPLPKGARQVLPHRCSTGQLLPTNQFAYTSRTNTLDT